MIEQIMKEINSRFLEAYKQRDAVGMASIYTDDARILPPNEPMISGRAAIKDFWQNFLNKGEGEAILEAVSVEIKGDTLIEIGAYVLEIKQDNGQTIKDEGKHVVIWKQQDDGSWKWAIDIFNSNLPPTA